MRGPLDGPFRDMQLLGVRELGVLAHVKVFCTKVTVTPAVSVLIRMRSRRRGTITVSSDRAWILPMKKWRMQGVAGVVSDEDDPPELGVGADHDGFASSTFDYCSEEGRSMHQSSRALD
jgi:hypothetical protein